MHIFSVLFKPLLTLSISAVITAASSYGAGSPDSITIYNPDPPNTKHYSKIKRPKLKRMPVANYTPPQQPNTASKPAHKPQTAATSGFIANCDQLRGRLANLGLSGSELDAAVQLSDNESDCRTDAVNPSSGACGTFQSLPCGKWAAEGSDAYLNDAISYVRGRYGTFNAALAAWHSRSPHWY